MATISPEYKSLRKALEDAERDGNVTPVEGVAMAMRRAVAGMSKGGPAAAGGGMGFQVYLIAQLLGLLQTFRGTIDNAEQEKARKFLAELPELFRRSECKVPPELEVTARLYGVRCVTTRFEADSAVELSG